MTRHLSRPGWGRRFPLLLALVLGGLLALGATAALAVPGTQAYTGGPGSPTPDIERTGITLFDAEGDPIATGIAVGTLNFSLNGGPTVTGYCIDTSNFFETAATPNPVDITTLDPPTDAPRRALAWILVNRVPTGASTPEKRALAATAQVAVWLLVDDRISKETPTDDPALNDAAKALVAEALAATAVPATLSLSTSAPAAGATASTVTVTGRPGATVTLAVTSGAGTLSSGSVVIGPGGSATATLTTTGPGAVTVTATTAGEPRLLQIDPIDQTDQDTAVASATTLTRAATTSFTAAGGTPGTGGGTPGTGGGTPIAGGGTPVAGGPTGPVTPGAASLQLRKAGPATARVLRQVRYTIVVRNTGRATATGVVLRDRLPRGMSFVRSSVRSSIQRGTVVWRLGNIRPGRSRTVRVVLIADAGVRGTRTNVASVSATRVRPITARAVTTFRALVRRVQPAVTG